MFFQKNIVITGATRGLGKGLTQVLTRSGANVALLGRHDAALQEISQEIPKEQIIDILAVDLSRSDQIESVYHSLIKKISHIDLLINNAAGWLVGKLENLQDRSIQDVIATTITGSLLTTKHLLPFLKKGQNPHIINIISTSGLPDYDVESSYSSIPYVAAKWGQAGFSEALRGEIKKEGIEVTTVYPGSFANASSIDDKPEKFIKQYGKEILSIKQIVDAIVFCIEHPYVHSITLKK